MDSESGADYLQTHIEIDSEVGPRQTGVAFYHYCPTVWRMDMTE